LGILIEGIIFDEIFVILVVFIVFVVSVVFALFVDIFTVSIGIIPSATIIGTEFVGLFDIVEGMVVDEIVDAGVDVDVIVEGMTVAVGTEIIGYVETDGIFVEVEIVDALF